MSAVARRILAGGMFEGFTERALNAVVLAQEEARRLQHDAIGSEHLLLGLLRENDSVAGRALNSLGISEEWVRAEILRTSAPGVSASEQIPFTPVAKTMLRDARAEAQRLGHTHIGTEHVLVAVLRQDTAAATRIVLRLDVEVEQIQAALRDVLDGAQQWPGGSPPQIWPPDVWINETVLRLDDMSDRELDTMVDELLDDRRQIAHRHQIVQGKIDMLAGERRRRQRQQ